jgi:hypothetical protein
MLGFRSYETAWAWLHKLRRAMATPTSGLLKGEIEVGRGLLRPGQTRWRRRSWLAGKTIVIIAVEDHGKGAGRIRLARIPNVRRGTLHAFVLETVQPGSTVITDGWQFYSGLEKLGYIHEVRQVSGCGKTADELLPHVHRIASLSKRWLLGTHQDSWRPEHLDYYLDEYDLLVQPPLLKEPRPALPSPDRERGRDAPSTARQHDCSPAVAISVELAMSDGRPPVPRLFRLRNHHRDLKQEIAALQRIARVSR